MNLLAYLLYLGVATIIELLLIGLIVIVLTVCLIIYIVDAIVNGIKKAKRNRAARKLNRESKRNVVVKMQIN